MPKISVIVPVYKVEKYLHRCVDSILAQTFEDFELILVDDGSPDKCGEICDEYSLKDSRVHVIHQENGGLSEARNAGINWVNKYSDSEWISFVDSDDWIHNEMLQHLFDACINQCTKISICYYTETSQESVQNLSYVLEPLILSPNEFYLSKSVNATVTWGKLFHKTCFDEIRFPKGKIHEDEFVTYKVLFKYPKISIVPVPLYYYYINSDGITKSKWTPDRLVVYDAFEEQLDFFKDKDISIFGSRVRTYVGNIVDQMGLINSADKKIYNKYNKLLKKKLRFLLKTYSEYFDINKDGWVYVVAYPVITKIYYKALRLMKLLKNKRRLF